MNIRRLWYLQRAFNAYSSTATALVDNCPINHQSSSGDDVPPFKLQVEIGETICTQSLVNVEYPYSTTSSILKWCYLGLGSSIIIIPLKMLSISTSRCAECWIVRYISAQWKHIQLTILPPTATQCSQKDSSTLLFWLQTGFYQQMPTRHTQIRLNLATPTGIFWPTIRMSTTTNFSPGLAMRWIIHFIF